MPSFSAYLNDNDVEAIRNYLIDMGRATLPGAPAAERAPQQPDPAN